MLTVTFNRFHLLRLRAKTVAAVMAVLWVAVTGVCVVADYALVPAPGSLASSHHTTSTVADHHEHGGQTDSACCDLTVLHAFGAFKLAAPSLLLLALLPLFSLALPSAATRSRDPRYEPGARTRYAWLAVKLQPNAPPLAVH